MDDYREVEGRTTQETKSSNYLPENNKTTTEDTEKKKEHGERIQWLKAKIKRLATESTDDSMDGGGRVKRDARTEKHGKNSLTRSRKNAKQDQDDTQNDREIQQKN